MSSGRNETVDDSHKYLPLSKRTKRLTAGKLGRVVAPRSGPTLFPEKGEPTLHIPGSAEKVDVMIVRGRRRESLCHPFDARYPYDLLPLYWGLLTESERHQVVREQLDSSERPTSTLY